MNKGNFMDLEEYVANHTMNMKEKAIAQFGDSLLNIYNDSSKKECFGDVHIGEIYVFKLEDYRKKKGHIQDCIHRRTGVLYDKV